MTLNRGEFELDGYLLSPAARVLVSNFDPGTTGFNIQEVELPSGPGRRFGREWVAPQDWTFEFTAMSPGVDAMLADMADFAPVWLRSGRDPGTESILRFNIEGSVRRVYGRPRRWSYNPLDARWRDYVTAGGMFALSDPVQYDDEIRLETLYINPVNRAGGVKSPLTSPLTTVSGGTRQGVINDVGGELETPIFATFIGPITNPKLTGDGWEIGFDVTLSHTESVTVDTRLFTALRNDGASMGGKLTRGTRLNKARIKPGATELNFSGIDATGTAQVIVTWRPAYNAF